MLRFRAPMLCSRVTSALVLSINRIPLQSLLDSYPIGAESKPWLCRVLTRSKIRATYLLDRKSMSVSANALPGILPAPVDERENAELLTGINDKYGGVLVELKESMDSMAFASSLKASIKHWRLQGICGVWLKLPIDLVHLVQPAVQEGFWYHHAEPTYLMLVHWLPATEHTLPVNATHRVGVGGFVMNEKREVLVVQEKSGILRGSGVWKFPTGVIDQGEDIIVGAIREVKEETGIDTEFVEVLAFRQSHKAFFGKSDLFFMCMLRPLSSEIKKQESEIEAAEWMPIEVFAAQPFVQKHELMKHIVDVSLAKVNKNYAGFSPIVIKSAFDDGLSYMYLNNKDFNQPSKS